jgi:hypothetical protein
VRENGYLEALVGTVGGALVFGGAPALVAALVLRCDPNSGFDCLGEALLVAALGIVGGTIGALVGCYLALRRRRRAAAGVTTAALIPVALVASAPLGIATQAVETALPGAATVIDSALALVTLGAVPLGARWLALAIGRRRRSRSDSG